MAAYSVFSDDGDDGDDGDDEMMTGGFVSTTSVLIRAGKFRGGNTEWNGDADCPC